MSHTPYILFCENPLDTRRVDEDFEDQYQAAKKAGFHLLLFSFDELILEESITKILRKIPALPSPVTVIYRGWMLTPSQYSVLQEGLQTKNYHLINSPSAYQHCHYLPENYPFIQSLTPKTFYRKITSEEDLHLLIRDASQFGESPVILKDYVKSEKHHWETACFVDKATNTTKLLASMQELMRLRGSSFNEGICIREFIELKPLTVHTKSGMPLTEEYRLFFYEGKRIALYPYWEEGDYPQSIPNTQPFEEIARSVQSRFFSMDIARKMDGSLIIMELGDGQVSGLPDSTDIDDFYQQLYKRMMVH